MGIDEHKAFLETAPYLIAVFAQAYGGDTALGVRAPPRKRRGWPARCLWGTDRLLLETCLQASAPDLAAGAAPDPDAFFHQEFVCALFERAVASVRREYGEAGRSDHFTRFERYDLAPDEGVSYGSLGASFGLTTTQVTNHLAQVRRRLREHALEALRALCGSDEEFEREARDLFGQERG